MTTFSPDVSVIVPAHNEENYIGRCLAALERQVTTRSFEVIVVDSASTDETMQAALRFADRLHLRVLHEEQRGRGRARRTGFAAARGRMILSTDADAIVPPDWVEELSKVLEQGSAIAVTGPTVIEDCSPLKNHVYNHGVAAFAAAYKLVCGYQWLAGAYFGVTKEAYNQAGGFDASFDAQEDMDLTIRLWEVGNFAYLPDVPVTVSGRRFKDGLIRGIAQYPKTYVETFWLGRQEVKLTDVR